MLPAWLEVRGLRCVGRLGAYPGERDVEQELLVDVGVCLDVRDAVERDALEATLDLTAVADVARRAVGSEPHVLVEALAGRLAGRLLDEFAAIQAARVRVAKPTPPGLAAAEEAAEVTLVRAPGQPRGAAPGERA